MCKVSVIVPCYNQESFLAECLESVRSQTFGDWECIIINDGSVDHSEKVANEYVSKDSRFRYLYQQNQGVVAARNNAIVVSKGKYVLPLDGDDKIDRQCLELSVAIMDADDRIRLVYWDVEFFDAKSGKLQLRPLTARNQLAGGCCVNTSLYRRRDYDIVGGYKPNMKNGVEDMDFFISLVAMGGVFYHIPKVLFYYRAVNNSRNRLEDEKVRKQLARNMVSNNPDIYAREYRKLYKDWMRCYEDNPLMRDTYELITSGIFYAKIIHANVLCVKALRKVCDYLLAKFKSKK